MPGSEGNESGAFSSVQLSLFSVFVVAASGGGDLLVDVLTDLQGNILTRLYRNIQHDLTKTI